MKPSSPRFRRVLWLGGAAAAAVALLIAGVTSTVAAQPTSLAGTTVRGPGYPPPGGIYKAFTNCPLNNPIMHEFGTDFGASVCTAGLATGGSVTIGNITTQVTEPVNVQFGWTFGAPGQSNYPMPVYSPLAGVSAILSTKPDLIPESLTTALSCSTATDPTVQNICQQAQSRGGVYNQVFALAQEAGQLSNFRLLSWTQPVKFKLINPLLGNNCYIGTDSNPIVLNPSLSLLPGGSLFFEHDPNPSVFPFAGVLGISGAEASDTTFSAPGVLGCGPGGFANGAVDSALNASSGLPAASGNSLTLTGSFLLGADNALGGSPVVDYSNVLLAAFKASTNGGHSVKHLITMSQFKSMLHFSG
jgi:hypothetical protein